MTSSATTPLSAEQVLALVPQQKPFRYIDTIEELTNHSIVGTYQFRKDEWFYAGHFPGNPVTPGVILLESMAQVGVVALGIYLLSLEVPPEEIRNWLTFFSDANVEFLAPVYPGDSVKIIGEKIFWRRRKLRSQVTMIRADGTAVARCEASGLGVRNA